MRFKKMKNLFLRQSYLDSWEDYERSLRKRNFIKWDYIILTASNEAQADAYREQISERLEKGLLPESTHYAVLPDPDGKRVGSGGATFQVMKYIGEQLPGEEHPFKGRRILVIHSGGDSKRVPQYSAVGKLFSPVPRELPDGVLRFLMNSSSECRECHRGSRRECWFCQETFSFCSIRCRLTPSLTVRRRSPSRSR